MGGEVLREDSGKFNTPPLFFFTDNAREKEAWEELFHKIDWQRLFALFGELLGENSGVSLIKRIQVYPHLRSSIHPQKPLKAKVDFEGGSLKIGMRYIGDFRVLLSTLIHEFVHIFGYVRIEKSTIDGVNELIRHTQDGFANLESVHRNTLRKFNEGTTDMIAREIFRRYAAGDHGDFEISYPNEMRRVRVIVRYFGKKSQKMSEEIWREIKKLYSEGIDVFDFLEQFGFSESTVLRLLSGTK